MNSHHLTHITHPNTLRDQAHLSLRERSVLFHRRHPETFASPSTLARVYKSAKIKFKKIKRGKKQINFDGPYFSNMMNRIQSTLDSAFSSGCRVVFMDETLFSFSTYQKKSWSPRGNSLVLDEKKFIMIPQALIMTVSLDRVVDVYHIHHRSISIT